MEIKIFNNLPDEAYKIRTTVFCDEQGFVDEIDGIDSNATHFVVYYDKKAVATCRVYFKDNKFILGRFAVLKEYRKMGIGHQLISSVEKFVKSKGYNLLILHSQLRAVEFYQKCGYSTYGEIELEENHPHIWMKKLFDY